MKKYLGNYMTKYVIFGLLLFIVGPIIIAYIFLSTEINFVTVALTIVGIFTSTMCIVYFIKVSDQLISVAYFTEDKIAIKNPLKKKKLYEMKYKQCADIGIGSYMHVVRKVYFIYISYNWLTPEEREHINCCHPSETFIKMGYSKKNYDFLMSVLPEKQAKRLLKSNEDYLLSKK